MVVVVRIVVISALRLEATFCLRFLPIRGVD